MQFGSKLSTIYYPLIVGHIIFLGYTQLGGGVCHPHRKQLLYKAARTKLN